MASTYFSKGFSSNDPLNGASADEIFEKGFQGVVHDGQVIYDPSWLKNKELDMRPKWAEAMLQKAGTSIDAGLTGSLGTGGAGTAGSALIPVYVIPEVVDQTNKRVPIRSMIRRVAMKGKTYDFNKLTAKGGAHWRPEHGSLAEDVDTYDRVSVAVKFGYSVGEITGPAIAAMRGFIDAQALDLGVKTKALMELEEDTIINGDASTYPTEFTGLVSSITTNTTNKSSAYVSLANMRTELATCFQANGQTDLIVTDVFTHNYVKSLLMDFQRQPAPPANSLPFGIPGAFEFDGVPVIASQYMETTSGSRRMLFLDTRYILMAVLQDMTFEELPTQVDSRKYMLKVYEALVVTFEGAMSQIYGIL